MACEKRTLQKVTMNSPLHLLLALLLSSALGAGKVIVERDTVTKTAEFDITILPESVIAINLQPMEWKDYKVSEVIAHGSYVKADDPIIKSRADKLIQTISDLEQSITLQKLETKLLSKELEDEKILSPLALKDVLKEKARNAEDFQYFVDTKYGMLLKQYQYYLKSAEWYKKNADEELKQLKAMYEADDLTEETEEIILERAEYQSEAAAWSFESAKIDFKESTEQRLPRQLLDKTEAQKTKEYYFARQEREISNAVKRLELELQKKLVTLKRDEQRLSKLKDDEKLLTLNAPADGIFYYGVISDGKWSEGTSTDKFMKIGGALPTFKDFACIIPDKSNLFGFAQVEPKIAGALKPTQEGFLEMSYQQGKHYPIQCREIRSLPLANGKFLTTITLPKESPQRLNHTGKAKIIIEQKKDVLSIPLKALKLLPSGEYQISITPKKPQREASDDNVEDPNAEQEKTTPEKTTPEKRIVKIGLL